MIVPAVLRFLGVGGAAAASPVSRIEPVEPRRRPLPAPIDPAPAVRRTGTASERIATARRQIAAHRLCVADHSVRALLDDLDRILAGGDA